MTYPYNPVYGQLYVDRPAKLKHGIENNGTQLYTIVPNHSLEPGTSQLGIFPALQHAWEEYLLVRKLSGL
jgi:hypothetical protein